MRSSDVARLVALAAIWGASFVFIRVVAHPLGPVWTAAVRLLIGGGALVLWLAATRTDAQLAQRWRAYAAVGAINSAVPFVLFAYAARSLPAAYMVVLNAVTPLFAAVLAVPFLGERLTAARLAGIALGVAGVALLSGAGGLGVDAAMLGAVAACLGAALCYAAAGIWLKRHGSSLAPAATAAWGSLFGGIALLPAGVASPAPGPWSPTVIASVLVLGLVCSAVAYLLYYRLIRDLGPTRAATVTFLMPAFGMTWGALFLDETITWPMLAGAGLIVAGTAAVLRPLR